MHLPSSTRRQCTSFLGGRSVKNNGLNISHWSENMYLFGTEPTEAFACPDATALTARTLVSMCDANDFIVFLILRVAVNRFMRLGSEIF
jgi:hypothetical protein